MDIKGGAVRPLPLYEDMKKLFAVFRVLGVLGILGVGVLGVFRVGVLGVFGVLRVIHEIYLHFLYPWYGDSFTHTPGNMQKNSGKTR